MPSLVNPDPTRLETSGISDSIAHAIDPVVAQPAGAIEQAARNNILALREGFAAGENLMRLPLRNAAAKNQLEEFNAAGKLRPITQQTEEARLKMLNDEMAALPLKQQRAEEAYQYGIKQQAARRVFEKNVAEMGSMAGKEAEVNAALDAQEKEANQAAMEASQAPDAKGGVVSQDDIIKRDQDRKAVRHQVVNRLTKAPTYLDILGEASKAGFDMSPSDRKELQDELAKRGGAAFPIPAGYKVASVTVNDDGSRKTTLEPIPPTGPVTEELDANGIGTGFFKDSSGRYVPPTELATKLAQGKSDYPAHENSINSTIRTIDEIAGDSVVNKDGMIENGPIAHHPGLNGAVGNWTADKFVPGSDRARFFALHKKVMGAAFLQGIQSMKGTGAITEMEGNKAAAAVTSLNLAGTPEDYLNALSELRGTLEAMKVSSRKRFGLPAETKDKKEATGADVDLTLPGDADAKTKAAGQTNAPVVPAPVTSTAPKITEGTLSAMPTVGTVHIQGGTRYQFDGKNWNQLP